MIRLLEVGMWSLMLVIIQAPRDVVCRPGLTWDAEKAV